jgi:sigma-E factor negative regulatory protein RseC
MESNISHSGVVESVEDGCVHVRIVQTSACAACKVAGYCNASESKEKLIDVYHAGSHRLNVGDAVTVTASTEVAAHALLLGFGLPFVVMVTVLVVVLQTTGNEGRAALSGLLALVPYYAVLYLFRNRLRDKLSFSIE